MASSRPWASRPFGLLLMLLAFPSAIYASTTTNGVEFLFPTLNVTLHYGDYVQVQYISNFSDPWLFAFCLAADGSIPEKITGIPVGGYNNSHTVQLTWSGSESPCWFDLKPNSTTGRGGNSEHWFFDISQRAATTVGLDSPSSSTASGSQTSTSTSSASASSSTASSAPASGSSSSSSSSSSPSSSSGSGLSTGAQAGIGVGAAIVGIALGAVAAVLCMRRRRTRKRQEIGAAIEADRAGAGGHNGNYVGVPEPKAGFPSRTPVSEVEGHYPMPQELATTHPGPYEMDTTRRDPS